MIDQKIIIKSRLLKLANHLDGGKLNFEKFDNTIMSFKIYGNVESELPFLFKKLWRFDDFNQPCLITKYESWLMKTEESLMEFFELSSEEYNLLFDQDIKYTSLELSKIIKNFVELKYQ